MNYHLFYQALYQPLLAKLGPLDSDTMVAIVGFDAGGPLNFRTFGRERGEAIVTYVSCELALQEEQQPSSVGRYELLASSDSEEWVRAVLSDIGRMSIDVSFDADHTMDIVNWVDDGLSLSPLQGVLFREECRTLVDGRSYGVLRVIGITKPEMEFAHSNDASLLVQRLVESGVYPHTLVGRSSVV